MPSHFTQRYTVCMYAVPFYITVSHFTQHYAVRAYAVLFDIILSHFTQRYTVTIQYNTIQYNLFYVGNVGGGYPIPRA